MNPTGLQKHLSLVARFQPIVIAYAFCQRKNLKTHDLSRDAKCSCYPYASIYVLDGFRPRDTGEVFTAAE